ncbi:hypothetical protein V8F33_004141 [Rhypophila sp. PSN 637]
MGLDIPPGSRMPSWMETPTFRLFFRNFTIQRLHLLRVLLRPRHRFVKGSNGSLLAPRSPKDVHIELVDKLSAIWSIPNAEIDGRQPIAVYGLDSVVCRHSEVGNSIDVCQSPGIFMMLCPVLASDDTAVPGTKIRHGG